jgi:hypothetical protein
MGDPKRRLSNEHDFARLNRLQGSGDPEGGLEPEPPSPQIQKLLHQAGTRELQGLLVAVMDELRQRDHR